MKFGTCLSFCLLLLFPFPASTLLAAAPPQVKAEIHGLLNQLEASGCDFNRNGKWYSGEKARQHLLRKLEYIEKRGDLQSTEQFINLAASESSFTSQAYLVRCRFAEPIPSKLWLLKELQSQRQEKDRQPGDLK